MAKKTRQEISDEPHRKREDKDHGDEVDNSANQTPEQLKVVSPTPREDT